MTRIDASTVEICSLATIIYPSISNVEFFDYVGANLDHILVPSCTECNSLASAELDVSLEERMVTINRKLEKKYKKNISASVLDSETDYMSGRLRRAVEEFSKVGLEVQERIKYQGFDYEIAGVRSFNKISGLKFSAFGKTFSTATAAIRYSCYRNKISLPDYMSVLRAERLGSIDEISEMAKRIKFIKRMDKGMKLESKNQKILLTRSLLSSYIKTRPTRDSIDFYFELLEFACYESAIKKQQEKSYDFSV